MNENMVIVFNGDTLDLMKRLEQYSGQSQKVTLDFMLENFKIMEVIEVNEVKDNVRTD